MVRNFILMEVNVALKIYKTITRPHRILYSDLGSCVETWKLGCNIEIGGHAKKNPNNNSKKLRGYHYGVTLEKLRLTM